MKIIDYIIQVSLYHTLLQIPQVNPEQIIYLVTLRKLVPR